MSAPLPSSLDEYRALFAGHGDTDDEYLARHWRRFLRTFSLFSQHWSRSRGLRVLDIGAHWLHQSVLYTRVRTSASIAYCAFPIASFTWARWAGRSMRRSICQQNSTV